MTASEMDRDLAAPGICAHRRGTGLWARMERGRVEVEVHGVQLIGGVALHRGKVAEMDGEEKPSWPRFPCSSMP